MSHAKQLVMAFVGTDGAMPKFDEPSYPKTDAEFREWLQHPREPLPINPNLKAWMHAAPEIMKEIADEIKAHPRSESDLYIKHPDSWERA